MPDLIFSHFVKMGVQLKHTAKELKKQNKSIRIFFKKMSKIKKKTALSRNSGTFTLITVN